MKYLGALLLLIVLAWGSSLSGPDDTQASQDVADDVAVLSGGAK